MASVIYAGPSNFAYQGQIIKPNGLALEAASVTFTLEILSPGSEECLLYKETQTINMTGSNGIFALEVGSGVHAGTNFEDTNSLDNALSNTTGTVSPTTCAVGSTYTPVASDGRKLRVTFDDGTGPVTIANDHNIVSVPYAQNASSIDGLSSSNILQVNTTAPQVLSQSNLENIFSSTNYSELLSLLSGSSTQFCWYSHQCSHLVKKKHIVCLNLKAKREAHCNLLS